MYHYRLHSAFNPDYGCHFRYSHNWSNISFVTNTSEWRVEMFNMVAVHGKCWDVLQITLSSVANRLPECDNTGIQRWIFGCSKSCMLSGTKYSGSI
jgi:hypothetical protein